MPVASLILSTYNSPGWLEKVLWSLEAQTATGFEVIVADDGSGPETEQLIGAFRRRGRLDLRHVWHDDDGFRKTDILNAAIRKSGSDYLIFTDGDCVLRQDFISLHLRARQPDAFLSGGYFKLSRAISESITEDDIRAQRCFDLAWLRERGHPRSVKNLKLTGNASLAGLLNRITPTKPSWNGHNASTWKSHVLAANGFDTRMKYGGEDREFGERLLNAGLRPIQIRYSAICVHLDHARGYVTEEMVARNREIWMGTKKNKTTRTAFGLTWRNDNS